MSATRLKQRLGYYRARSAVLRPGFERALRQTDVFLVGHPKSGNTWLAYMLAVLRNPDANTNLRNVGEFVPVIHGRDERIAQWGSLADPRVFRNEIPRYPDRYPNTLYLMRDPRAVLVSFWHMCRVLLGGAAPDLDAFVDGYLTQTGVFRRWYAKLPRWDAQVERWLDRRDGGSGRILVLGYESLVADRTDALASAAEFLGLPSSGTTFDEAVRRGDIEHMRAMERAHGAEAYAGKRRADGAFVRAGRPEGWRDELPDALRGRIESELGPAMQRAGYL